MPPQVTIFSTEEVPLTYLWPVMWTWETKMRLIFFIIDHSESFWQFTELLDSLESVDKGWEKSVGIIFLGVYFLRDLILISFSHRCTIQPAFPGHHTQLLADIMAAAQCQDYWLHHQVWEAWVPCQRSGPSAPPWCHRGYYYWYCCFHTVIFLLTA